MLILLILLLLLLLLCAGAGRAAHDEAGATGEGPAPEAAP